MRKLIITTATAIAVAIGMVGATAPALADPVPAPPNKGIPGATVDPPTPRLDVDHKPKGVKAPKGLNTGTATDTRTACASVCYKYSTGAQLFSAGQEPTGASIRQTVSNQFLDTRDYHTVVEMSMQNVDPVTGNRNVVEIGQHVDRTVNGDADTHLFVFSWVNGVQGSYNGGNGYAHAVGCSPCAGDSIQSAVGTAKTFEWQHIGTAWWAKYNANYVGAFPDSTWGGNFTNATVVQNFGEVAASTSNNSSDDADESCSDMGSGGHAGTSSSTSIDQYTLTGTAAVPSMGQGVVSVPGIWGYVQNSPTWIRIGGEGDDSIGEALGTKGSCAPAAEGTPAASSLQVWKEQCPDGAAVTGCNSAWSKPWSGQVINACHPVSSPDDKWRRVWGNYLSSGKSFYVYASGSCGSTRQLVTNASKLVTPWDIHGWARAA